MAEKLKMARLFEECVRVCFFLPSPIKSNNFVNDMAFVLGS